ncbi:uncharacterized protein LOC141723922 [Apium graveolens]|uniref:uncharacterized protein LOC141723922 n=1 Tax=Apium graveolens TaxID=4045 RepID=UPI003D7AEC86
MVSPVRTFIEELVAKVKGKAPSSAASSESSSPNDAMNLSVVKAQCADMFSAFCSFVGVLIAKLKSKVTFNPVSGSVTLGPFIVSFPYKKKFPKLVMERSDNPDEGGQSAINGKGRDG